IVEIMNDDGTMARRPDLEKFAKQHKLKIGTIEDLIRYRIENEKTVERVSECDFPNEFGHFRLYAYQDELIKGLHFALVKGEINPDKPAMVRVHMENPMCDLLSSSQGCGWPLRAAMKQIADSDDPGVLVVLRKNQDARDIVQWMLRHPEPEKYDPAHPADLRTHGVGAQILRDLNVHKMHLMTAPKRIHGLAGFGLEVVDYVTGDE
ncbi:MAG: bifunctional 3,4-dihydroxy-2-butanone-4-phosphate synthase/GTP cyclohydrolase II, partial [Gammaproteobacteria bacterium]